MRRSNVRITGVNAMECPAASRVAAAQSGVRMTPSRLERMAAQTAPATLPRAVAVRTEAEEMVEGRTQR